MSRIDEIEKVVAAWFRTDFISALNPRLTKLVKRLRTTAPAETSAPCGEFAQQCWQALKEVRRIVGAPEIGADNEAWIDELIAEGDKCVFPASTEKGPGLPCLEYEWGCPNYESDTSRWCVNCRARCASPAATKVAGERIHARYCGLASDHEGECSAVVTRLLVPASNSAAPAQPVAQPADFESNMARPDPASDLPVCLYCDREIEESHHGPPINDSCWSHVHNGVVWCNWPDKSEVAQPEADPVDGWCYCKCHGGANPQYQECVHCCRTSTTTPSTAAVEARCEHGVLQSMECLNCTEEYVAVNPAENVAEKIAKEILDAIWMGSIPLTCENSEAACEGLAAIISRYTVQQPEAGYVYEDQLPPDMPKEDYDKWYAQSWLSDGTRGVRIGSQYPVARTEAERLKGEVEQLQQWKQSAMLLLSRYDSIAETFDGKLGSSKLDNLERGVRELRTKIATLEQLKGEGNPNSDV